MFYLHYAARNLWRNRRWSAFAVLSIAAGVATIVALRSLGLAIGDLLTSNLRATNHGDVTITESPNVGFNPDFFQSQNSNQGFQDSEIAALSDWVAAHNGQMTVYLSTQSVQVAALNQVSAGRPQFTSSIFIDPASYPPTYEVTALDPPGVPLKDLLTGGNQSRHQPESGPEQQHRRRRSCAGERDHPGVRRHRHRTD